MKFWLTFITQNRLQDISEMTQNIYPVFDGIVAVDHFSNDGTFELLQERKGRGAIIQRPFVKHHAHSMNDFLFSGVIKNGDYFMILDSSDRINPLWLKRLRDDVNHLNKNNVGAVFLDRVYIARFIDSMEFFGGVHWGLRPFWGRIVNWSSISGYRKESFIFNTRNDDSVLIKPSKYWYCYGHGNSHTQLLYQQFSNEIWQYHENIRMQFRLSCQFELGLDFTLESLINYMKENIGKYPEFFEQVLELEVSLKDLFRFKVLNQSLPSVCENRFNWSYFKWKETGQIDQNKYDGYTGVFNQYKIQKGESPE